MTEDLLMITPKMIIRDSIKVEAMKGNIIITIEMSLVITHMIAQTPDLLIIRLTEDLNTNQYLISMKIKGNQVHLITSPMIIADKGLKEVEAEAVGKISKYFKMIEEDLAHREDQTRQ